MNNLLLALEDACRRHPLREKVLIVPTYSLGRELCEGLAMERTGWVNLHPETPAALAHKLVCDNLAENNLTLLTGSLAAAVVEEVFQELEGMNALPYFKRKGNSPGLIRAIAASLYELRLCGITGDNLAHDSFVSAEKGQDLIVTSIPPLPLAAQIVMKKMVRGFHHLVMICLRRRYTTKHGEVSRRLLFLA